MREVKITQEGQAPEHLRMLVTGAMKSGKTFFAATAPRPLFISDAAERGYETIFGMDRALWWNPEEPPEVWAIERHGEVLTQILPRLEKAWRDGAFPWRTVVFDPISLYSDRVLSEIQQASTNGDNRAAYGDLGTHLRTVILRFNALPAHLLWLSHVKDGKDGAVSVGIQGQTANTIGAWMRIIAHMEIVTASGGVPQFQLRTKPFGSYKYLGGSYQLPDPLTASFKAVAAALKMREQPVSPTLPGPAAPAPASTNLHPITKPAGGFAPPAPRKV